MRPETEALHVLSTTRAKAKMFEFRVPLEDHIALPRNPDILFSLAVGILGDAAAAIADDLVKADSTTAPSSEQPGGSWDAGDNSLRDASEESVTFAATYFDAFLGSRLNGTVTNEFSLLCAASYCLADSPGSARVVIRNTPTPNLAVEGGLPNLAHAILADDYVPIEGRYQYRDVGEPVRAALRHFFGADGDDTAIVSACGALRISAYAEGTPRQLLYADIVLALCHYKLSNASRRLLPPASDLDLDRWRPALLKPHFPKELWPAQRRICDAGLLMGRSAVIQMPTSAGKTRATELIVRSAFLSQRTGLAVIVAPFRSLCHDIRGDLAAAFAGENISLNEATDSYQFDLSLEEMLERKTILIVTPEKLLYMLRRAPDLSNRIGLVIYDEGHQFEGMARGPNFELLLTSLKITLPPAVQVVLMSAVIGNAGEIAAWLVGDPASVVSGEGLLPTTKSIAFASWHDVRGRLEYVSPQDPNEREFYVPRVIEAIPLDRFPRERAIRIFPMPTGADVGLYLGLKLVSNGSVAVFCGRKDSAALLCDRAVEVFTRNAPFTRPISVSDGPEVTRIASLFERHLGARVSATQAATLGIFPHHANVPHGLRLSIEHAMKKGLAKFVVCTSTLAQGVNFPIKYLIVTTTQQGQERIMVRDFHNLIGRAGRAGMHTEGSVIFSSPEVYDGRRTRKGRWRWGQAKNLLDPSNAEPINSSILSVFAPYKQTFPPIVLEMDAGQLQMLAFADSRAIETIVNQGLAANPQISASEFRGFVNDRARAVQSIATFLLSHVNFEDEAAADRVEGLATNTLAYHLAPPDIRIALVDLFQAISTAVLNNSDANLRSLIRRSPLSPAATTDLRGWLEENINSLDHASQRGELLAAIYDQLAAHLTAPSVKAFADPNILLPALEAWVSEHSFEAIHAPMAVARVRVSNHYVKVEDVVALCEHGFGYDAAMIVASLADFAEALDDNLRGALALLQQQIKYGLRTPSAMGFFEAGFADRVIATELATLFPDVQNRSQARAAAQQHVAELRTALGKYPSYFGSVLDEIAAA